MFLADTVRRLRTEAGFTQQELAKRANLSIGFIRDLEQGRRKGIEWASVQAISAALGVSCEVFREPPAAEKPKKKAK